MKIKAGGKTYDVVEITLGEMSDVIDANNANADAEGSGNILMQIAAVSVREKGKPIGMAKLRALRASAYQPLIEAVKDLHLPQVEGDEEKKD